MVRRFLAILDREIRGLHEAAYLLAGFALLSQILALVRDRAFAHFFGAGPTLDMYFAAFRVPDTVFAVLTLFVSSFALVPLFAKEEREGNGRVLESVLLIFGAIAVPLTAVVWFVLPYLMPLFVPGFSPEQITATEAMARIMLLQPLLLGISSIAASYMQAKRRFLVFALAPILYNVGIIMGTLFLYPFFGPTGLAWGVVFGALLHLFVQLIPSRGVGLPVSRIPLHTFFASVVVPSVPRSLALMANQLLLVAFAALASLIAVGAVSSMTFAFNLQSVPLTIIGLSYASALFPALSSMVQKGEWDAYAKEVWATVRHILFWLLPATMFFIVLRAHIVRVVLGSGAFSWDDTRLTAAMLALFCVSLAAQAAILTFSRAYYAAGKTLVPILLNVGGSLAAAVLAFLLVTRVASIPFFNYFVEALLRVGDVPGTTVLMIPAAYSISITLVGLLFAVLFAVRYGFERSVLVSIGASFSASVIGAGVAYLALQGFGPLLPRDTFLGIFTQGAAAGGVGLIAWILILTLVRSEELSDVLSLTRTRFFSRIYGPTSHT